MSLTPVKYPLRGSLNRLMIPGGLCGTHIGFQYERRGASQVSKLCLWTSARLDQVEQEALIFVAGTGQTVPHQVTAYLGSAINADGTTVMHAYSVQE